MLEVEYGLEKSWGGWVVGVINYIYICNGIHWVWVYSNDMYLEIIPFWPCFWMLGTFASDIWNPISEMVPGRNILPFTLPVRTPLTGGAVGAWVSSWQLPIPRCGHHTDIATRTNMNQTKLISKFGSCFLFLLCFFWWTIDWYFPSQVVASYVVTIFATTYKPTTKSQRVNPPLKDTRWGNSSSYLFGDGLWVYDVFLRNFPKPSPQKKSVCF